jgi:hypothetical protein
LEVVAVLHGITTVVGALVVLEAAGYKQDLLEVLELQVKEITAVPLTFAQ